MATMTGGERVEGRLVRIRIYPIKALDPLEVDEVEIGPRGALARDRGWAIFDGAGRFLNGKRCPAVHGVRARFEADGDVVWARREGEPASAERRYALPHDAPALSSWLGEILGEPARLGRDTDLGFPDDAEAWGPTVVSAASLEAVAAWFPEIELEAMRRRFRANLEIAETPPFWEDRLFGAAGTVVPFRIGDVAFTGTNPCQRCAVPTRDPHTGEPLPGFQRRFQDMREATLPPWADRSRFNHFYRFTLNTRIAPTQSGKRLRLGDPVILG